MLLLGKKKLKKSRYFIAHSKHSYLPVHWHHNNICTSSHCLQC